MLKLDKNKKINLPPIGSWPETVHEFDEKSIWAINAALTAERPLLVRGEPGIGKSQLARAAAVALKRVFISAVVHARSECQDLQWDFDAVGRLGEAQALAACGGEVKVKESLDPLRFLNPGPLWWTFNWESAKRQSEKSITSAQVPEKPAGCDPKNGSVLLIDEIDKADADLPNGLLETLGNGAFSVRYIGGPVRREKDMPAPLVVITTNEERELPRAFLRRCMVLQMRLAEKEDELITWLTKRGQIHFGEKCSEKVRIKAAQQLWKDRCTALKQNQPAPGQAEYLDILRALSRMWANEAGQLEALKEIKDFAFKKYPEENG